MRVRASAVVTLSCALALAAGAACAQDQPATSAAPADTAKKAAATKAPAKASPAAIDAAVKAIDAQIAKNAVDKKDTQWRQKLKMPTVVKFDPAKKYLLHMGTSKGDITIEFLPAVAPMHVTNFIYLTRLGFYDGLTFHRVITSFMAQGGCPIGNGTGGPGYGFGGEFSPNVLHNAPGMLSMANTGQPNSDGSQFFLTFVPTPWLDGKHTLFGKVVSGMDVLKALEAKGSQSGATSERLAMTKVTVEVK
jgi:cyclophilin family peptidyl-prolyl cis-trans isomerase